MVDTEGFTIGKAVFSTAERPFNSFQIIWDIIAFGTGKGSKSFKAIWPQSIESAPQPTVSAPLSDPNIHIRTHVHKGTHSGMLVPEPRKSESINVALSLREQTTAARE